MNKTLWMAALLSCLLLSACKAPSPAPGQPDKPVIESPGEAGQPGQTDEPAALDRLTMELVVDWDETDRVLACLDQLSGLLSDSLLAQGYAAEEVVVTISTAGGITGSALAEGGIDAACMPAADFAAYASQATAVLATEGAAHVVAVTAARDELDAAFQEAFADALLEPEAQFLGLCYPGEAYAPITEDALQAVRSQGEAVHGA